FVLPSESEGFPNAVLEAMAAGLPIVASDLPALREIVTDKEDGLLVPSGDPDALARALCCVIGNRELAWRMGGKGRESVRARFSVERMVSAFEAIYVRELGRLSLLTPPVTSRWRTEELEEH